jgi:hypothetical protein
MREAVYDDAIYIARVLKDDEKKIWALASRVYDLDQLRTS